MNLKELREYCKLTQMEMAEILETTQSGISRFEHFKKDVKELRVKHIFALAEYAGLNVNELFELIGDEAYATI